MRVTSSMYYKNIYGDSNSKLSKNLFDVNKQISSGLQIQYAHDDIRTFTETMRLDNEITTLGQVKKSVDSGYKFSSQTDSVLNEFQTSLDRVKVLLIQASNSSQSDDSMDAIANELRGLEEHFMNLSNTSIDGKYIFSGSLTSTKPIDADGIYKGNDIKMNVFAGSGIKQSYNLDGAELFLGENKFINKEITTNVPNYSLTKQYPDFTDPSVKGQVISIKEDSTIRDLMGDINADLTGYYQAHFYVNGVQSNGDAFNTQIDMSENENVSELLDKIGKAYGNTSSVEVVNVRLNELGEIVVEDKLRGSSKLDFNMVGAVDFDATSTTNDSANISNATVYSSPGKIDNLKYGETDFYKIISDTSQAANENLFVKKFVQSPFDETTSYADVAIKAVNYSMSRAVESGDTLSITMDDGSGGLTTYNQNFVTDAQTTYEALKSQVEADGDFVVNIDGDNLSFELTGKGLDAGAFVNADLSNDDGSGAGAVTISRVDTSSKIVSDIESMLYDRVQFSKKDSKLISNVAQIVKETNAFASPATKISEVADISKGTDDTIDDTLDGSSLILKGQTISGSNYDVKIDFKSIANGGSTFSLDTDGDGNYDNGSYDIFNTSNPREAVNADDMTYQQLIDVTNMVVSGTLPASDNSSGDKTQEALDYDKAIADSQYLSNTKLSYDGKIEFEDFSFSSTKASLSIYDSNAGDFSTDPSIMTFNANNALVVKDAKTDFFKELDRIIKSVENHERYPDASNGDLRNVGIENAISMVDDLSRHVGRSHASVGAQSTALTNSLERAELLEISTMTLRSDTIDTDLAEASLNLAQLNLNYQAMLSTVGKISQLSLVNYL